MESVDLIPRATSKVGGGRKLLGTSASLLVTSALLVVTMFAIRNKCPTTSNNKNLIRIVITSMWSTTFAHIPSCNSRTAIRLEVLQCILLPREQPKEAAHAQGSQWVVGHIQVLIPLRWAQLGSQEPSGSMLHQPSALTKRCGRVAGPPLQSSRAKNKVRVHNPNRKFCGSWACAIYIHLLLLPLFLPTVFLPEVSQWLQLHAAGSP